VGKKNKLGQMPGRKEKTKNPFAILFSNPNLNVNQIKFEYGLNFFKPDQV